MCVNGSVWLLCSLQDMSPDIVTAVSSLCEQLCVDFSLQKLHPQAKGGEGEFTATSSLQVLALSCLCLCL